MFSTLFQWKLAIAELSNRSLLKEYRELLKTQTDIQDRIKKGWQFYLGENIYLYLYDVQRGIEACEYVIKVRKVKVRPLKVAC